MATDDSDRRRKYTRRLYANLATWEIVLWSVGWVFAVGYSIYHVYLASQRYWRMLSVQDLEPGYFGSMRKDVSDSEWHVFSQNLLRSCPWLFLHLIGTQYFKKKNQPVLPVFHVLLSLLFVWGEVGFRPLMLLLAQPLTIFSVARLTKKSWLVWAVALAVIIFNDMGVIAYLKNFAFEHATWHMKYITHVFMFWVNSRCVSFCLDHIWGEVPENVSIVVAFIKMIAFCFYLPTGISGPLINYKEYHTGMYKDYQPWTGAKILKLILLIFRYLFWYVFVEIALHFFYFSAIRYEPKVVERLDLWTLCGLGYSMGQFFCIKYVFFYGFTRPFVMADGIDPPNHPKCIGRIHLYSDMWRFFDQGLHRFMHRYIYVPIMGDGRGVLPQLFAATMCFSFVYLWHGIMPHVLIWSFLNYFGVVIEAIAKAIWRRDDYQRLEKSILSHRGQRRFHAAISAPLFMLSIISNFYFLMGDHIGSIFMQRGFGSWPIGTPTILFFMYCGAQTSIEVKNWEIRKEMAKLD